MKTIVLLMCTLLAFSFVSGTAAADNCSSQFTFCPAKEGLAGSFADCTQAPCVRKEGRSTMSCACRVKSNIPSTTSGTCQDGTKEALQSRYSLVESMGVCTSATNLWGFCLDIKCSPGVDGWTICECTTVNSAKYSSDQYVIVGGNPDTCSMGYSSATPGQVLAATAFLRCKQPGAEAMDPTIVWLAREP